MALIVQKYGGTSVGSIERIQAVADRIIAARQQEHDVVVVVSAMHGETDKLIQLAHQIHAEPNPREYSVLVSTGEQVSIALLSMMLHAKGHSARSYTGHQVKILTDQVFDRARILDINCEAILHDLAHGCIPVVAGFQGVDHEGNITTLGRGGSDTTAVALAAAIKADECQIYTDVEGVYTSDPHIIPQAKRLDFITCEEMLELSSQGAKVLQLRSVEFAGKYSVRLRVLSSFIDGPGTVITYEDQPMMEQPLISGVAFSRHEAKLTILGVPDVPGVVAQILGAISAANVEVDMIIQNIAINGLIDFTFTVNRDYYLKAKNILEQVAEKLHARGGVKGDNKVAKLALVGVGMRSNAGIATKMFEVLAGEGINIQLISTSEIKVSVVIDEKYVELGARALHTAFDLDKDSQRDGMLQTKADWCVAKVTGSEGSKTKEEGY